MRARHPAVFAIAATLAACATLATLPAHAITLYDGKQVASVIHEDTPTAALAARLLARDLEALSGVAPRVSTQLTDCGAVCVVLGRMEAPQVSSIAAEAQLTFDDLQGAWERYRRAVVTSADGRQQRLLIAGSDTRGAIWGVIDLTRELGLSAWEWWADVAPRRQARIVAHDRAVLSNSPSVRYRGIFLNDEDWGLQPWAAKTYDNSARDIGPATYARIYELLWRLKANTIWPAMHDSTKPFYQLAGNPEMARDYAIVVGTSHAEPMMRNNVREWRKQDGPFNFFTNRATILAYWQRRVDEVKQYENFYSLGLRGVHDSPMEGARDAAQARDTVAEVMHLQREMLAKATGKPITAIPQALTLYKEVLDLYKDGLQVPDDATIVWPDDNYGYLAQLTTPAESQRKGGAGIYYHLSYWGRPHDYLWLGTTHPALVRDQLQRAVHAGANRLWIVNVGDIKPLEYLSQYFLDIAFDHGLLAAPPAQHARSWMNTQFGAEHGPAIAALQRSFYDLAWERRPEFMGFGQTEPTRPNGVNAYLRTGGEEAQRRLARYAALQSEAERLGAALPPARQDAYFELVLYPIRASASLNQRILRLELAATLARQQQNGAQQQVALARAAHAQLVADTAHYNKLAGGKWRHMMDLAPRRLPVFQEPVFPTYPAPAKPMTVPVNKVTVTSLPASSATGWQADGAQASEWEPVPELGSAGALAVASPAGKAGAGGPAASTASAASVASAAAVISTAPVASAGAGAMDATADAAAPARGSLRSLLSLPSRDGNASMAARPLTFRYTHPYAGGTRIKFVAVPVHPLTSANSLKIAVRIDDGPAEVLDFRTYGRSDEWKENVLSNSATRTLQRPQFGTGRHTITVTALDPGFILDRIDIIADGAPDYYGAPPLVPSQ